jgi:hypothetical protein
MGHGKEEHPAFHMAVVNRIVDGARSQARFATAPTAGQRAPAETHQSVGLSTSRDAPACQAVWFLLPLLPVGPGSLLFLAARPLLCLGH